MHVNAKKMAFSGLLLALTVILVVLSGVFDFNTLFLLAAASFLVGVIIREFGLKYGIAFYIAAAILGFLAAPNKLYCITFSLMSLYVLLAEAAFILIGRMNTNKNRKVIFLAVKFVVFNIIYVPMLFAFPKLLFAGELSRGFIIGALLIGQVVLVIYDKAYDYFQAAIWNKFRKYIQS